MAQTNCSDFPAIDSARRTFIANLGLAFAGLMAGSGLQVAAAQQPMGETPARESNRDSTSLHQDVDFAAPASRIEGALLDEKQFAAFTGLPATIDPHAGGAFSMFGGLIVGRNVELLRDQRIVQAWRPTHWDPGVYSIVRFEFRTHGAGTTVVLDHTGFPAGQYDHLKAGWQARYWGPLKKFLA